MAIDISVIIPTFNRAAMVCDCVASVLAQGNDVTLEVVVVDDCSPDDTKAQIEERFGGDARVKYIRNDKNSFQAVSRNNGAKVAGGEFLLFLDDDNLLGVNALVELVEEFRKNPKLGFAAPMAVHKRPGKNNPGGHEQPKNLSEMLTLAKILSKDIPFIRTDFYNINEKVFFGELTFYPASGMSHFEPDAWDNQFGKILNLDIN